MPASAEQRGSITRAADTRTRLIVVAAAVIVVAAIVVITVLATSKSSSSSPPPTHLTYRQLFNSAVVGTTKISVLSQWPKPYQVYTASPDQCYEWYDNHVALYNLCFLKGVLHAKDLE
jgi:hypothetical protein